MIPANQLPDPDEDYITEEEDIDQEAENDRREIQVGDDNEEPDPEYDYLLEEPLFDPEDDEDD
jgi:hypothetical protein